MTPSIPDGLAPGAMLGAYRIERRLGRGGMGAVYLAYDTRLHRHVALKTLDAPDQADARTRLLREARNAAALNHPHICTVHEVSEADGTAFIAMEYVEGVSLAERIGAGTLPPADAVRVAIQAADALAYAHARGVVHRDFKAANAMLTADGRLKVVDFGLARRGDGLVTDATTAASLVGLGWAAGTPYAMAPEQVRGETADARADVWALGVLLYELVSGRRPFSAPTTAELFSAVLAQDPAPLPSGVPAALGMVIDRCLAKPPAKRYQHAGEVRDALEAVAGGTTSALAGWWYRVRRYPMAAASAALVAAVAVVLGANVSGVRDRLMGVPAGPAAIRLAVLPFENLTGDPEQEYLSDGLTDEMTTELGRLHPERLSVIARTSSMRYKGRAARLEDIGRELGVDYVLEGSARREGRRVRVATSLVRVRDQAQQWADSFDHDLSGILALQREVARGVAGALALTLLPAEQARLANARAVDAEAYEATLQGLSQLARGSPANWDRALAYFELALQKDSRHARAHLGIRAVWSSRRQFGFSTPAEATPHMRAALARALELDDSLGEAHAALAEHAAWTDWDWAAADTSYRRALELNPSLAEARAFHAHVLLITRRTDEALDQMQRALQLDPLSPTTRVMAAATLALARRYDEALLHLQQVLSTEPSHVQALGNTANVLHAQGRQAEAIEAEQRRALAGRGDPELAEILARGYAEGGYRVALRRAGDALAARSRTAAVAPNAVARFYGLAGETDATLDWLERGFEVRDPNLPYIGVAPAFDHLREHPRFQALLARLNL